MNINIYMNILHYSKIKKIQWIHFTICFLCFSFPLETGSAMMKDWVRLFFIYDVQAVQDDTRTPCEIYLCCTSWARTPCEIYNWWTRTCEIYIHICCTSWTRTNCVIYIYIYVYIYVDNVYKQAPHLKSI